MMNPLTNMKNVLKLSDQELKGNGKTSWHDMYKGSAWIFVGGLSYDLTEGDILCIFSQYGEIVNINLIRDKATGKSKGYCFICFEDQRSTILTVDNLNGIKTLGRTLRVDHVSEYKVPKENDKTDEATRRLYMEGCAPKAQIPAVDIKKEPIDKNEKNSCHSNEELNSNGVKIETNVKIKTEKKSKKSKKSKDKKPKKEKKKKHSKKSKREKSSSDSPTPSNNLQQQNVPSNEKDVDKINKLGDSKPEVLNYSPTKIQENRISSAREYTEMDSNRSRHNDYNQRNQRRDDFRNDRCRSRSNDRNEYNRANDNPNDYRRRYNDRRPGNYNHSPSNDRRSRNYDQGPSNDRRQRNFNQGPSNDRRPRNFNQNPSNDRRPRNYDRGPSNDRRPRNFDRSPSNDYKRRNNSYGRRQFQNNRY